MAFITTSYEGDVSVRYDKNRDLKKEYKYEELWEELFGESSKILPRKLTSDHRIVFVDADALVYRISSVCESKTIVALFDGKEVEFKNKTKLKEYCKRLDVDINSIQHEERVSYEDLSHCLQTIKRTVAKLKRTLDSTHIVFFLGGSYNFRSDLPLPVKYKENRKTTVKPKHLEACREYLVKYFGAMLVHGIEADDVVQGATEYVINKTDAYGIAYNLDKDFHTSLTKNRYWHITKQEIVELSGGLGSLYTSGNSVKGDGLMWMLFQLNQGDESDGYSPKPLFREGFKGRYGEKSFLKEFSVYRTERELLIAWVQKWRNLLPDKIVFTDWKGIDREHDWLSLAELYFQCLYMRMSPFDFTTFSSLLLKHRLGYLFGAEELPEPVVEIPTIRGTAEPKKEPELKEWEW